MRFPLRRFYTDVAQTLGMLEIGQRKIFTLENGWLNNQPNRSCIPEGDYPMEVIRIAGVEKVRLSGPEPERTLINIESSNYATELLGCIATGMSVGLVPGAGGIFDRTTHPQRFRTFASRKALAVIVSAVHDFSDRPCILEVRNCFPR